MPSTRRALAALGTGAGGVVFTAMAGHGVGSYAAAVLIGLIVAISPSRPALAGALLVATAALAFPDGDPDGLVLTGALATYCLGREASLPVAAAATLATIAIWEIAIADGDDTVPLLLLLPTGLAAGRAVRERVLLADQLAERAAELEAEREIHAELSVRYERARIARELHDVVAHAISVMVVQAGAGQRLAQSDPAATTAAFAAIGDAARQAERDVGQLVALLSDPAEPGEAPDLALVAELIGRAANSGLDVTLSLEGDREGLPTTVARTAYLVVREALTNALRYASGAPVRVRVDGQLRELVVEVVNGPAGHADGALSGHGTGNGLRGLREALDGCRGRLEAGPADGGGWRVHAAMPRT